MNQPASPQPPAMGPPAGSLNPAKAMGSALGEAKGQLNAQFNTFRNSRIVSGATEFLYSNSLVAKLSFLILIVLLFIFFMRLGSQILNFVFGAKPDPYISWGLRSGRKGKVVPQDPLNPDSITLLRSKNQREGLTYTYTVWLNIDNLTNTDKKKHIFHKGSSFDLKNSGGDWENPNPGGFRIKTDDLPWPNMSPGVFIEETQNKITIYQNTYEYILENVTIDNIPIGKWFHLAVRLQNRDMDIFINGNLAARHKLTSPPKQNYGNVYITQNEGFQGQLSNLRYFNQALSGSEINMITKEGPNLKAEAADQNFPPYLSLRWYFQN